MDFGIGYHPTHDGMRPGALAGMLEQRGQDAVLFAEHTHIPATDNPGRDGFECTALDRRYWHGYELFVALTAAAAATSRLRVGSGICLVTQRDPIITAKQVASVDHLSGGRFEFGVGAGWHRGEMRNHGTDPRLRMAVLRERVEAMKVIWTQEEASHAGDYVNFERIWSHPKPAQRPHPPILVGGDGPTVLDRVLTFGDGWLPNYRGDDTVFDRIDELRSRADRPIEVHMLSAPADPAVLERMARAGVRRANHWLPSGPLDTVERALVQWENAIGQFIGA
ncbi:TIGR03619 family F420-dependent LLM class oxidoreductase [Pseudonocardia spinosispora]|uniref:TIGR03619 family F420-dependent LLM class oxidoreductase n=1 Tax=Pseudonocardia spinosispora TaxID=103441 RepID=UPI000421A96D|nr:TIGR03619 family F420-dependent LLM class oxidoreductase [Pseudonocardia spinosispora]